MRQSLLLIPLILACAGCGSDGGPSAGGDGPGAADARDAGGRAAAELDPADLTATAALALAALAPETAGADELEAAAACACLPDFDRRYLQWHAGQPGALTQLLVPQVRSEVRDHPILNALLRDRSVVGALIKVIFANDHQLNAQIRSTVAERLAAAGVGGSLLRLQPGLRIDAFARSGREEFDPASPAFTVATQADQWGYAFGLGRLFEGAPTDPDGSRALHAVAVARALMGWNYLFGLSPAPDGGVFGGLTLPTDAAGPATLAPFDPRAADAAPRLVTGTYRIVLPATDAATLALNGGESWRQEGGAVALGEQSRLWRAAARAFSRLRPANRGRAAAL